MLKSGSKNLSPMNLINKLNLVNNKYGKFFNKSEEQKLTNRKLPMKVHRLRNDLEVLKQKNL